MSGNKRVAEQSFDQEFTKSNKAIAMCCAAKFNKDGAVAADWKKGKPIRVVRGFKGRKHSKFAPEVGKVSFCIIICHLRPREGREA